MSCLWCHVYDVMSMMSCVWCHVHGRPSPDQRAAETCHWNLGLFISCCASQCIVGRDYCSFINSSDTRNLNEKKLTLKVSVWYCMFFSYLPTSRPQTPSVCVCVEGGGFHLYFLSFKALCRVIIRLETNVNTYKRIHLEQIKINTNPIENLEGALQVTRADRRGPQPDTPASETNRWTLTMGAVARLPSPPPSPLSIMR